MIRVLQTVASDSSLEEIGDDVAFELLNEAVVQLQDAMEFLKRDNEKAA